MMKIPLNPDDPLRLAGCVCPQCKYELKGATSCMCPECGEMFTVTEVRSNRLNDPLKLPWIEMCWYVLAGVVFFGAMLLMQTWWCEVIGGLLLGVSFCILMIPSVYRYLVQ